MYLIYDWKITLWPVLRRGVYFQCPKWNSRCVAVDFCGSDPMPDVLAMSEENCH